MISSTLAVLKSPASGVSTAVTGYPIGHGDGVNTAFPAPPEIIDVSAVYRTDWQELPADFPSLGFHISKSGSSYVPSFDPDDYATGMSITRTIYVNRSSGNDSTGDGTSGTPYKTVRKACDIAKAGADTSVEIRVVTGGSDVLFYRDEFSPTVALFDGKRLYITPDDVTKKIYITSAQAVLTWTLTSGKTNTYQATRAGVRTFLDYSVKDINGIIIPYTHLASIDSVEAQPSSWYTDGTTVYAHTSTGASPVNGTHLACVEVAMFRFDLANSAELFVRNCFGCGYGSTLIRNNDKDYTDHKFIAYDCAFCGAGAASGTTSLNGLSVESVKTALIFNSLSAYNESDGFNCHYTRIGATDPKNYLVGFFNCLSYNNGIDVTSTPNINNAFTAHEGVNILLVGCEGYNCEGPIIANVNGCYTVAIGCYAHGSTGGGTHGAFYFDGVGGKAWLDNCIGSDPIYDLNSDGNVSISARNCLFSTYGPGTVITDLGQPQQPVKITITDYTLLGTTLTLAEVPALSAELTVDGTGVDLPLLQIGG